MEKISAGKFHLNPPSLARLCVRAPRQAHGEHRAFAVLPRHGHIAAHHARELAREGKTESRAAEALSVASAWVNSSNNLACCSAVMPIPVSETANSTKLLPLLTLRAASLTSPACLRSPPQRWRIADTCRALWGRRQCTGNAVMGGQASR